MGEAIGETNRGRIAFDYNPSLVVSFNGGEITSDAGVLLLRQLDETLGLTDLLAQSLCDPRNRQQLTHPMVELLRERVYMLCQGYEDTNDARTLRNDPALKLAVRGRGAEAFRAPLGSQPTVSRLEHEILLPRDREGRLTATALRNLEVLEDMPLRWTERVLERHQRPERLVVDLDSSEDRVYGKQEGATYNGYFEHTAFHPLFAHLGDGFGELVKATLRSGHVYTSNGVVDFCRPLLPRLLALTQKLCVRADSGFAVPELFEHLEALDENGQRTSTGKRVRYVIKLKHNSVLDRLADPYTKRGPGRPAKHTVTRYAELSYRAESWQRARRVVLVSRFRPGELFAETAFLVTNATVDEFDAAELDAFYVRRGDDSENRIKEAKGDVKIDRTSCHAFESNRVRLALTTLAYLLGHWVRTLGREPQSHVPPPNAPSLTTLRLLVLKIGARLLLHARRVHLLLSSACPAQELFRALVHRLRTFALAAPRSLVRLPLSSPSD
jgi:hypothetical protein